MTKLNSSSKYFRDLVESKTKELNELSAEWSLICNSNAELVPEQIQGDIRCACGLAKLLIDERFDQFSRLIDQSEMMPSNNGGDGENFNLVLASDLEGFWEMIYQQVVKVEQQFKKLYQLKSNNYVEPNQQDIASNTTVTKKLIQPVRNKFTVKSKFAEFRKAQLNKAKENVEKMSTKENNQKTEIVQVKQAKRYNLRDRPINKDKIRGTHVSSKLNSTPKNRRIASQLENLSDSPLLKIAFISSQGKRESLAKKL